MLRQFREQIDSVLNSSVNSPEGLANIDQFMVQLATMVCGPNIRSNSSNNQFIRKFSLP